MENKKIGIISTVKSPLYELKIFVKHHLNIGIAYIVLFFDDPKDDAIDYFSKNKQVITVRCSPEYWEKTTGERPDAIEPRQIANVNFAVNTFSKNKFEWLIHIDSDELINPVKTLKHIFSKTNEDAIRFSVFEAVADNENQLNIFEPKTFKKKSKNIQLNLAIALGCKNAIFNDEYFRGHSASKMAIKISNKIQKYGIHGTKKKDGELIVKNTKQIELLHYDCIGIKNWKSKWNRRLDGSGTAINMRNNRVSQLTLYEEANKNGEEAARNLYKRMHLLTTWERFVLTGLGMLKRRNLRLNDVM
jgi:hypothetical protein